MNPVFSLEYLSRALKVNLAKDSLVVFQTEPGKMLELSRCLENVHHLLKQYGITALVLNEDTSIVVVPEARRALVLPRDSGTTGSGSTVR